MGERCGWCGNDPQYISYHDDEWGVPERDGRALWEKLILDGFQAGLAWITILRKRDNFREAFAGFDPEVIAGWGEADIVRLLGNPGIIRHRGKIEATIGNARAYLDIGGSQAFVGFAAVVERAFGLNGLGSYLVSAAASKDFAVVQGISLVLITIFVVVNTLVDVLYSILDPRVTVGSRAS